MQSHHVAASTSTHHVLVTPTTFRSPSFWIRHWTGRISSKVTINGGGLRSACIAELLACMAGRASDFRSPKDRCGRTLSNQMNWLAGTKDGTSSGACTRMASKRSRH
eukprot:6211982-Pleurochrysis_carterae.AAC.4